MILLYFSLVLDNSSIRPSILQFISLFNKPERTENVSISFLPLQYSSINSTSLIFSAPSMEIPPSVAFKTTLSDPLILFSKDILKARNCGIDRASSPKISFTGTPLRMFSCFSSDAASNLLSRSSE